jgi:hypothetical protein
LMLACAYGRHTIIDLMIENGANVEFKDAKGNTAKQISDIFQVKVKFITIQEKFQNFETKISKLETDTENLNQKFKDLEILYLSKEKENEKKMKKSPRNLNGETLDLQKEKRKAIASPRILTIQDGNVHKRNATRIEETIEIEDVLPIMVDSPKSPEEEESDLNTKKLERRKNGALQLMSGKSSLKETINLAMNAKEIVSPYSAPETPSLSDLQLPVHKYSSDAVNVIKSPSLHIQTNETRTATPFPSTSPYSQALKKISSPQSPSERKYSPKDDVSRFVTIWDPPLFLLETSHETFVWIFVFLIISSLNFCKISLKWF